MRRLVITENMTMDGVVENDGSWFDPTEDSLQQRELATLTRKHAAASDGFLVGRVTFEEMRKFWPTQVDDQTGVTDHLNQVQKYVVSSGMEDPGWERTSILRGGEGLSAQIDELKAEDGTDIVLTGSIALAQSLLGLRLVDELRLFLYPVILGKGRRLFPDGVDFRDFQLAETQVFSEGVVLLRYTQ